MAKDTIIRLRVNEIKEIIKTAYKQRHLKTRTLCLVGHKGVGKTELVKQCATELGIECKILNLQVLQPCDISLPYIKEGKVNHAYTCNIPVEGAGILFLDETNRCDRDVRNVLITLLQERKINEIALGKDWIIILAMNPIEADGIAYEVQDFDAALEDRIARINFEGNTKDTITYLNTKYPEHPVIKWIEANPEVIDFKGATKTSPRALEYLISRIGADNKGQISPDNKISLEIAALEIGKESALALLTFLETIRELNGDMILKQYSPAIEARLDALINEKRNDILNRLNTEIAEIVLKSKKLSEKAETALMKYLEKITFELFIAFWIEVGATCTKKSLSGDEHKAESLRLARPLLDKSPIIKERFLKQQAIQMQIKESENKTNG